MFAIADAAETELFDLENPGDCSSCEAPARVLARGLNEDGHPFLHGDMCTRRAEALGGEGAVRDFRKRDFRSS